MTRMARTHTNMVSSNNGLASVGLQSSNHAVPNVGGASDGLNPLAGDLTQAFNNFFGKVSSAAQTLSEGDQYVKRMEAQEYAQKQKESAFAFANQVSQENPGINTADAMAKLNDEQKNNRHFLTTYEQTLGSNTGAKIWSDFTVHMQNQPPQNFESEAQKFWKEKFGDGTGNPNVDSYMQSTWVRNFEHARVVAAGEALKQTREEATNSLVQNAATRIQNPDFGVKDITALATAFQSHYGNETPGMAMSRALGALKSSAIAGGRTTTQRFLSALHATDVGPDGQPTKSFAQQFPAMVAEIEGQTTATLENYVTMSGQKAVQDASTELTGIISDNRDEFSRMTAIANWMTTRLPQIENTPGVGHGYEQLRSAALKELNDLKSYKLGMNRMGAFHMGQSVDGLDAAEVKKYGLEYLNRFANPLTGVKGMSDEQVGAAAGQFVQRLYNTFGTDAISTEMRQQFAAGIRSADSGVASRSMMALKAIDGTGQIGASLLSDDAVALAKFKYMTQGNLTVLHGTPADRANGFTQAIGEVATDMKNQGGVKKYLFKSEGSADKIDKKFADEFLGRRMRETLDEAIGDQTWGAPEWAGNVSSRVEDMVAQVVQRRAAEGLSITDYSAIRTEVGNMMKDSLILDKGVLKLATDVQTAGVKKDGSIDTVPLGNTVVNPLTRKPENTVQTMREDLAVVKRGLGNLTFDGLEIGDITYENTKELRQFNGRRIVSADTGHAITLPLNTPLQMQKQVNTAGEEKSWFTRWGSDKVTFTGDPKNDLAVARHYLHPSVDLIPVKVPSLTPDGKVVEKLSHYEMMIRPRFKEQTKYSINELQDMAKKDPRNAPAYLNMLKDRAQEMMLYGPGPDWIPTGP